MSATFEIQLFANDKRETLTKIRSFIGDDDSGSFCILAGHDYFMTMLSFGMATLRSSDEQTRYLALPGGLLHFQQNQLVIHTRRYWIDSDHSLMADILRNEAQNAQEILRKNKSNLSRIEESMMKRMVDMERQP